MEYFNSKGMFFTLIKSPSKTDTSIMKKIDRVMANMDFIGMYGDASVMFHPFFTSNHSPAVLGIPNTLMRNHKSFRFPNYIADKKEFMEVVSKEWEHNVSGYKMFKLVKKLKNMKKHLNKLAWRNGNLFENVKRLKEELKLAQMNVESDPYNKDFKSKLSKILHDYNEALIDEEKLLAQQAKIQWLSEGVRIPSSFTMSLKVGSITIELEGCVMNKVTGLKVIA